MKEYQYLLKAKFFKSNHAREYKGCRDQENPVAASVYNRPEFGPYQVFALKVTSQDSAPSASGLMVLAEALYRVAEILFSLLALILTLPIMIVEAIIIRIDSPGPILFIHKRIGRSVPVLGRKLIGRDDLKAEGGSFDPDQYYYVPRAFYFVKFRTMYIDARERFPDWYNYNYTEEEIKHICFKVEEDPRVTRMGKWLRRLTVDEFPNFWNVLTGNMRLVGPRPEIPEMLINYKPHQMKKFTVKPGITGLPQINGRGRLSFQNTVAYDLEYVEKRSLFLDIKILLRTFWKVIVKHGAF